LKKISYSHNDKAAAKSLSMSVNLMEILNWTTLFLNAVTYHMNQ